MNVHGLNTAATIWYSAAMSALSGLGTLNVALVLANAVLLTNVLLRPLAYRLDPVLPGQTSEYSHLESVSLGTSLFHHRKKPSRQLVDSSLLS
jgi:putative Mg2+ transporter-C (MgtC) family protein